MFEAALVLAIGLLFGPEAAGGACIGVAIVNALVLLDERRP